VFLALDSPHPLISFLTAAHSARERRSQRGEGENRGPEAAVRDGREWGRQVGVGPQDPRQGGAADRGRAEPPAVRRRSPLRWRRVASRGRGRQRAKAWRSGGSSERRGRWPGRSGPPPVEETARLQATPAREEPHGRGAELPRERIWNRRGGTRRRRRRWGRRPARIHPEEQEKGGQRTRTPG